MDDARSAAALSSWACRERAKASSESVFIVEFRTDIRPIKSFLENMLSAVSRSARVQVSLYLYHFTVMKLNV